MPHDNPSSSLGDYIAARTTALGLDLNTSPSSLSTTNTSSISEVNTPTSYLSLAQLLWIQRILLGENPIARHGIREVDVWIGGETPEVAIFRPIEHDKILSSINSLLAEWRENYSKLTKQSNDQKILALATFHYGFLKIHPFLDGNGRVARILLEQQIREVLDSDTQQIFSDKPKEYYESLKLANEGNLFHLAQLIASYVV